MTLASLKAAVEKMTPGPWADSGTGMFLLPGRKYEIPGLGHCYFYEGRSGLVNAAAIVALRNHADALIRCAELLRDVRSAINCANLHHSKQDQHKIFEPCPVEARIDAALAEVEGK